MIYDRTQTAASHSRSGKEGYSSVLEHSFCEVYDKFKLQFYRRVFDLVRERDGSLSAMEAFSLEVISMLDEPTVGQFADFLKISQSNATYKVNNLIKKGYLDRQNSTNDRREYHLILTQRFYDYRDLYASYEKTVMARVEQRLPPEEVACFDHILQVMSDELMNECKLPSKIS